MIINIRHTGIVVNDLDLMSKFYLSLGFVENNRAVEVGNFIDQVVNIPNVKIEWIKLKSPDGSLLELLKYHSHPVELNLDNLKTNDLGCSHLAYTVTNIEDICKRIKMSGGSVENLPSLSTDGKVKVAYCRDPEGVLLEVVEEIIS